MFTDEDNELINPTIIKVIYDSPCELPMYYYMDIWSSLMDVAVHSYKIKEMPLSSIRKENMSVFFILTNALNNILLSIYDSTKAILNETDNISSKVNQTLLILLICASASLIGSILVIFPVAMKVDNNKDELLQHF